MRLQIQEEIKASVVYLSMGAYFSRDTVNRPGFAKMFIHAASEEREHGMKLMEYLLVRGKLTKNLSGLIAIPAVEKTEWANGAAALEDALKLEAHVTRSIREVIKTCENADNFNDYHVSLSFLWNQWKKSNKSRLQLVDYLTGEFLEEQIAGQRDIAGKLSTLGKMMRQHGDLGEFLFDKNL